MTVMISVENLTPCSRDHSGHPGALLRLSRQVLLLTLNHDYTHFICQHHPRGPEFAVPDPWRARDVMYNRHDGVDPEFPPCAGAGWNYALASITRARTAPQISSGRE
jgi:hypothetical protein